MPLCRYFFDDIHNLFLDPGEDQYYGCTKEQNGVDQHPVLKTYEINVTLFGPIPKLRPHTSILVSGISSYKPVNVCVFNCRAQVFSCVRPRYPLCLIIT